LPQFRREAPEKRQIAFAFTLWNAERDRPLPQRMALLENPWKLVSQDYGETWELYDLATDPAEANDIAAAHPAIVSRLREDWLAWFAGTERSRAGADYENAHYENQRAVAQEPHGREMQSARIPALLAALLVAACSDPPPPAHEETEIPRTFVGTATCGSCHAPELAAWQDSHHALAMQEAAEATVLGD